ncbi:uncharacterized protein BX663DRAFT_500641 [Cokeromyces recurvatus]|uniref:uncharacterized protein n=1 Tax=Cokeromyces recurvatus TaxID=90255 RepID=UPI0022211E5D|nr:uncharacterized protein BX663DRAFT_500641 [Cokeromyces recurvatus]KAI7905712.1 hypothetical protein BX663DRAFT_500641 [Cokeromyces recurvatus]
MNPSVPPTLPPGWIALWDETSQRYYYLEQSTGTTQWEIPTGASKASEAGVGNKGEAYSYNSSGYPLQQQQQQQYSSENNSYMDSSPASINTSYPTQNNTDPTIPGEEGGERGIGKIFTGFSGGAITGSLLGYAAGKYFTNKHSHHQGGYNQYPPPPPPPFSGGSFQYGQPHQHGHHGHHGQHSQHSGLPGIPGFPGYNPPPPSNYGNEFGKPPHKHSFW